MRCPEFPRAKECAQSWGTKGAKGPFLNHSLTPNTGPFLLFGNSVLEPEDPRVPSHLNRGALRTQAGTFSPDPLSRDWEGEDALPRLLNRKTVTVLMACARLHLQFCLHFFSI